MRTVGTIVRGIRTPIIRSGDDLVGIVVESVLNASKREKFLIQDRDIICVTEAVVSISDNNYASLDDIVADLKRKFQGDNLGIVYPILSRNRFSMLLRAFAKAFKNITMLLSFPSDEVGNPIMDIERLKSSKINPFTDTLNYETYRKTFGTFLHPHTEVDILTYYENVVKEVGSFIEFVFSNNPNVITNYTSNVLVSSIHTRKALKEELKSDDITLYGLDDVLCEPINGSGYNETYGLLGSNFTSKNKIKLFPNNNHFVYDVQNEIKRITGKKVEVMIYGDGAFKDPYSGIWELADPVVSPSFTDGLKGSPREVKLKMLALEKYENLDSKDLEAAIKNEIENKTSNVNTDASLGTTPRRYVDLIGSLADLTSGSGDKGTPVVYIQNYFKNKYEWKFKENLYVIVWVFLLYHLNYK